MTTPAEAFDSLRATLATVKGLRVQPDYGQAIDPPALVLPPPTVSLEAYRPEPSGYSFRVALVVAATDGAVDRLLAFLPLVLQAVYASPDASVAEDPAPGSVGTPPLPCYLITIEVT